jgi:hypothetical protein
VMKLQIRVVFFTTVNIKCQYIIKFIILSKVRNIWIYVNIITNKKMLSWPILRLIVLETD